MLPESLSSHSLSAQSYTDFSELARLRTAARRDAGGTLGQVAKQFESMFMQMMMKSMREASFGDPLLGSKTVDFYQGMLDDQLSVTLSANGSLGIAEILERQLRPLVEGGAPDGGRDPAELKMPLRLSYSLWSGSQSAAPGAAAEQVPTPAPAADEAALPAAATPPVAPEATRFDGPESFMEQLRPAAEQAARRLGVPAELLLAQAALETGWGRAIPRHPDGSSSYNLFGIKADGRWDGDRVTLGTLEYRDGIPRQERAQFRAYDSFAESFEDYVEFLTAGSRYQPALEQTHDPEAFMHGLHQAGYATDPHYADKVLRLWREQVSALTTGETRHG